MEFMPFYTGFAEFSYFQTIGSTEDKISEENLSEKVQNVGTLHVCLVQGENAVLR